MAFVSDPISDMIVHIKNANARKHKTVSMPHSKLKMKILSIIKNEGYIEDFKEIDLKNNKNGSRQDYQIHILSLQFFFAIFCILFV